MGGEVDRRDVFRVAQELGFRVAEKGNKKGYLKLTCPCGQHLKWLHKTPSGANYYLDTIKWMRRVCRPRSEGPTDE